MHFEPVLQPVSGRWPSAGGNQRLQRTFFANTGTEAMEGALKMVHGTGAIPR